MSDSRPDPISSTRQPTRRIAIVGGGISGLAAAHRLTELDPTIQVTLFEGSPRVGGILQTERIDGYLLERAADSFITTIPAGVNLCERLGLAEDLIPTNPQGRRALVVRNGRVLPVPEAFVLMSPHKVWPVVISRVLSLRGKLRLACERFIPARKETSDESVASFVGRRLGSEVFERLVQPLVAGIYTADPDRLSMQATMPQFVAQEQEYGSLWRAARHRSGGDETESGARYGKFVTLREGMQQLVERLVARLPRERVRTDSPVSRVARGGDGEWQVKLTTGEAESFTAVVIAAPAPAACGMLKEQDQELSGLLGEIPHAGASIVLLGVANRQISRPVDGFGFVIPRVERRNIIAVSLANQKFPGRAPEGHSLLRVFVGGALQPELAQLEDDRLLALVQAELADLLGLTGSPQLVRIARWPASMPQYHVGHLDRVAAIEGRQAANPGLFLAGNAYRGVGVPQCIASGEQAAEHVVDYLARHARISD